MRRVEAIKDLEGAGEANLAERLKEMDGWVGPATWSETGKPGKDRPFTWLIDLPDWFFGKPSFLLIFDGLKNHLIHLMFECALCH